MRSLQLLLVIVMIALSSTDVVAQKSTSLEYETLDGKLYQRVTPVKVTYVDGAKPEIPGHLIGEYLENGDVSVLGEKEVVGYSNFIFSIRTTQTKEAWKRGGCGAVYAKSPLLGQEVVWWIILAIVGIASMIVAQISKKSILAFIFAAVAAFAAAVAVVFVAATFVASVFALVAALVASASAFALVAAAAFRDINNKNLYYVYYVSMVVYVVAMYFAF